MSPKNKRNYGVALVVVIAAILQPTAFAGFLIDDAPADKPKPVIEARPATEKVTARVYGDEPKKQLSVQPLAAAHPILGSAVPLKIHVVHEGKIGMFGGEVYAPENTTIIRMLNAVLPTDWDMRIDNGVNRGAASGSRGGNYANWVAATSASLEGTNYVATIDWNKKMMTVSAITFTPDYGDNGSGAPIALEKPKTPFVLHQGKSLEAQVDSWATTEQWVVRWGIQKDWIVSGETSFGTDFKTAIKSLVETMNDNGVDIHADIYDGNRTVVIRYSK